MGWRYASSECDDDVSAALMRAFVDAGHSELDTARAYAGGDTEKIMGRVLASDPDLAARVSVATKANPWPGGNMTSSAGEGGLAPDELRAQVEASRAALAPASVDLLYLHAPDAATPIEDTLAELVRLRDEGAFRRLGLSNFSAWETVRIHRACLDAGLPAPDTYQGMYNCVTRAVEPELIPALRQLGMRFLAFNPLAGGVLTGKHAGRLADPDGASATGRGRFTENAMYQDRFWREAYFDAIDTIAAACEAAGGGLTPTSAALRWLYSHSALDGVEGVGVILGASSVAPSTRTSRRPPPRGGNLAGRGVGGDRRRGRCARRSRRTREDIPSERRRDEDVRKRERGTDTPMNCLERWSIEMEHRASRRSPSATTREPANETRAARENLAIL